MKKLLTLLFLCLLLCSCNKETKSNEIDYNVKNIDEIITYDIIDGYKQVDEYTLADFNDDLSIINANNIIVSKSYEKTDEDGYFSVEIFSYKGRDISGFQEIDENKYIDRLVKTRVIKVDNHNFNFGYSSQDDYDVAIARAYTKHDDYVILFSMRNSDNPVTEELEKDFLELINTVKFK